MEEKMNKIQIKAEILATLTAMMTTPNPNPSLLTDLKMISDKKAVLDILVRELVGADEHRSLIICWLLTELIDKEELNNELWDIIKSPDYNDHIKMIAFNMLKDLGSEIDYDVISCYFEKFHELINKETKELLDEAIMNPEAQIDFMDFMNALNDDDKIILIKSLQEDYTQDALANILIPVFLYYADTRVGDVALELLAKTKSQLAFHAIDGAMEYADENKKQQYNKALSELKLSGIRIDNTKEFYKEILKESKPYKTYMSFPDGHGNLAMIFSRIRQNKSIQFLAIVANPKYGIMDAFGFNSMTEHDFYRIIDKFYNYQEKYEVKPEIIKYLLNQASETSYSNGENVPYEYVCWESILLDIEPEKPTLNMHKKELNEKDIEKLEVHDCVQNWFFDEITSPNFKKFIDKLSYELKANNFGIDLDKFIADNFDMVYDAQELAYQIVKFNIAAYLRYIKKDKENASILYSLGSNYKFLTNILRKSIYEYYVGQRYLLKNKGNTSNMFEKKLSPEVDEFKLLQLDMIISSIETKWVANV